MASRGPSWQLLCGGVPPPVPPASHSAFIGGLLCSAGATYDATARTLALALDRPLSFNHSAVVSSYPGEHTVPN